MILADGHVHIHACFHLGRFFDAAYANFNAAAATEGRTSGFSGILLLTESHHAHMFDHLRQIAGKGGHIHGWDIHFTEEPESLILDSGNQRRLIVIAGRQVVTRQRLEVLALASPHGYDDGWDTETVIRAVWDHGGIPVIPWGFGKWMGKRGTQVTELIRNHHNLPFFLGDNSGRTGWLPVPKQFHLARQQGIAILPGSDPLPFVSQCQRAGRFGFILSGECPESRPGSHLKSLLLAANPTIRIYGKLESPIHFIRNQIRMQLLKHRAQQGRNP